MTSATYDMIFGGFYIRLQVFGYFVKICCSPANFAIQAALLNTFGEIEILQKFKHLQISIYFKLKSPL